MTEDFLSSHCQAVEEVPEPLKLMKLMGETTLKISWVCLVRETYCTWPRAKLEFFWDY